MKAHATPRHLLAWLPLAEEAVAGGGEAGGDLLGLGQHVGHAGLLALHGDSPVYPAPGMRGGGWWWGVSAVSTIFHHSHPYLIYEVIMM